MLLAPKAAHVTGICDTAVDAELLSSSFGVQGNVSFFGPPSYVTKLGARAYDLITCFDPAGLADTETTRETLSQLERVLKPDGTLLLAAVEQQLPQTLSITTLRGMLCKEFRHVDVYRQSARATSVLLPVPDDATDAVLQANAVDYVGGLPRVASPQSQEGDVYILVASAVPLGEVPGGILLGSESLNRLARDEDASLGARRQLAIGREFAELQEALTALFAEPTRRKARGAQVEALLDPVRARVENLVIPVGTAEQKAASELQEELARAREQIRILEGHARRLSEAASGKISTSRPTGSGQPTSYQLLRHQYWRFERAVYNSLSPKWRTRAARLRRRILMKFGSA